MESDILEDISLRNVGSTAAIDPSSHQTDSTKFYESSDVERNYEIFFSNGAEWETRWSFIAPSMYETELTDDEQWTL